MLRVRNQREDAVSVEVTVRSRESSDSREFSLDLPSGDRETFDDLEIMKQPVTVRVSLDGEQYEYTPQTDGALIVSIVSGDVEFQELVT